MSEKKSKVKDPYTSRNEFKKDFYKQKDKFPVTAETMYGTGTTRQLDESIMSPDDSMLVEYKQSGGKIKLNKKPKKAFMGLAVEAVKKGLAPLIGMGADKLLKKSKTARDVTGNLGVGGKLISNYYNDKESNTQSVEPSKEEPTFKQLKGGGLIAKGCGKIMSDRKKITKMY